MAAISLTYTLANGSTADASQVMQNYSDIVNGTSDGTKDFSIGALTCAGSATFNGNVALGNSSSDDVTCTGSLASHIPVKTNTSYNIGAATLGLLSVYIGGTSTFTTRLLGAATATWTLTLPTGVPTVTNSYLGSDTSGTTSWIEPVLDSPMNANNYTLTAAVSSDAMTIALKTKAGSDPTAAAPVYLSFRSATAATGDYSVVKATAATSVVVSSGSTLGHVSAVATYFYVYAINNAGTIELGVSTTPLDTNSVQSSTAEGGAGAADSAIVLYSTTARTSKAIRLLARMKSTQTTAGTWASVPTEISLCSDTAAFATPDSYVEAIGFDDYGSTNTAVHKWTSATQKGGGITYATASDVGGSFTINQKGVYSISESIQYTSAGEFGVSVNSSQLTTQIGSITAADRLMICHVTVGNRHTPLCWTGVLNSGDVIRAMGDTTTKGTNAALSKFIITQLYRLP